MIQLHISSRCIQAGYEVSVFEVTFKNVNKKGQSDLQTLSSMGG